MNSPKVLVTLAALVFFLPIVGAAQTPAPTAAPMAAGAVAQVKAKITAIDKTNRIVTLQDAQGDTESLQVGKDVTRFDALKVGDVVTFTYQESVATNIVKPGSATPGGEIQSMQRSPGTKPGGMVTKTQTTTVTVTRIDTKTPSISVKTQDGRTIEMLVHDKANIANLHVGDVVQVTYTQALVVTVK
jgi:hypothetical protein